MKKYYFNYLKIENYVFIFWFEINRGRSWVWFMELFVGGNICIYVFIRLMDEDVIIWKMEMLMICEFLFVIWLCVVGYLFYRCIEMLCKYSGILILGKLESCFF